ncbi:hypothetical protein [uncultured Desulfobulbus sp.]|uniref:hypothetical protein n=1 Tax=uncultured Desulfobulbus sp. TaxID=239745 RepID=UPI0029C7E1BF|nr:hypothetical protein [uncultured Desulfobulbus sp.]
MLQVGGKLGFVADLMPTENMYNLFIIKKMAASVTSFQQLATPFSSVRMGAMAPSAAKTKIGFLY